MNYNYSQDYEAERVAEQRAKRHKYSMPPGYCQYCCAPPDALYGCPDCGRPDYDDVMGEKYQGKGE